MSELQKAIAQVCDQILGKRLDDVRAEVEAAGWQLRRTRDGTTKYAGTCDYKPNRINIAIDDGVITEAGGKKLTDQPSGIAG